jgi:Family of unknown function (DUF6088)
MMERLLVENKVVERLRSLEKGRILFADDFLDLGSPQTINKALFRLKEKNILVRLAHGVYLYPKTDSSLGVLFPGIEEITQAIAKRDRARIIPTGVQALNKLGLSTQVPLNAVFLTDGAPRSIKVGKQNITFKKTSPKNLMAKGEISRLVIQSLKSIGQKKVDNGTLIKLDEVLKKEKKENILHDAKLAPAWINKILIKSARDI